MYVTEAETMVFKIFVCLSVCLFVCVFVRANLRNGWPDCDEIWYGSILGAPPTYRLLFIPEKLMVTKNFDFPKKNKIMVTILHPAYVSDTIHEYDHNT